MNLKSLFLKPIGLLCFLAAFSCSDNVTNDIENIEESISEDVEYSATREQHSIVVKPARQLTSLQLMVLLFTKTISILK